MDAITPALTDAYRLLATDIVEHLCEAEFLATKFTEWSEQDVDNARRLIPDLVLIIRGLLIEHQMTPEGTCRTCVSPWPCPVVTSIHALVKDPTHAFVELVTRTRKAE